MTTTCTDVLKSIWTLRPLVFTVGIVLAALPVLFVIDEDVMPERAKRCLYILIIMAFLWVTETLPVSVTALLPIVLFPMAGVLPAKQVSGSYVNDTTMLFFGGLLVAVAVEEWNLHKRIAILILKGVGSEPKGLMLGLMLPTWFMSMWISNTATTSMMIPIANAIIDQTNRVRRHQSPYEDTNSPIPMTITNGEATDNDKQKDDGHQQPDVENDVTMTEVKDGSSKGHQKEVPEVSRDRQSQKITIAFTLCVAYSANIGGIATLTGTPPNLILRGVADDFYRSYQRAAMSNDTSGSGITFSSWMSMALPLSFIALVLAWIILVLVFLTGRGCCSTNPVQKAAIKKIVDKEWKSLGKMTNIFSPIQDSGLSLWLGQQFAKLDYLDTWVFNMVICFIVAAFTEVTSNTATATILMPILADLGVAIGLNPLYLMMSSAIATSFAFMLPVATAPNAIVFSYGQVRIIDMASVGLLMNVMAVGVVTLCVNTWGKSVFDFDHFDPIFKATLPTKDNGQPCI